MQVRDRRVALTSSIPSMTWWWCHATVQCAAARQVQHMVASTMHQLGRGWESAVQCGLSNTPSDGGDAVSDGTTTLVWSAISIIADTRFIMW
jgi:hypothetical protein